MKSIKALMILGAIIGFLIGVLFGIAGRGEGSQIIWKACTAALAAAFLMRWWGRVWIQGLQKSLYDRAAESSQALAANRRNPAAKL